MEQEEIREYAVAQEILDYLYGRDEKGCDIHCCSLFFQYEKKDDDDILDVACDFLKRHSIIYVPNLKNPSYIQLDEIAYEIKRCHESKLCKYFEYLDRLKERQNGSTSNVNIYNNNINNGVQVGDVSQGNSNKVPKSSMLGYIDRLVSCVRKILSLK